MRLAEDGDALKILLTRLTGHGTFPNVFVEGVSLGGSDDLQRLHSQGELLTMLENAGVSIRGDVGPDE